MMMIRMNSSGNEVEKMQSVLSDFGVDVGKVDGVFGLSTLKGVKTLQSVFSLKTDGIVGNKTLHVIDMLDKHVKHFKIHEFKCKHCSKNQISLETLLKLELLRKQVGGLIINSGYRCVVHNTRVGGSKNSRHVKGDAVDLRGLTSSPDEVYKVAVKIFSDGGVGKYKTFTHVDTRGYKARW